MPTIAVCTAEGGAWCIPHGTTLLLEGPGVPPWWPVEAGPTIRLRCFGLDRLNGSWEPRVRVDWAKRPTAWVGGTEAFRRKHET